MNKLLALSLLATATASGSAAVPASSNAQTPASHKLPSSLAIESATHVAPTSATSRSKGLTVSAARRVALRFENSVDGGVELDSDYEFSHVRSNVGTCQRRTKMVVDCSTSSTFDIGGEGDFDLDVGQSRNYVKCSNVQRVVKRGHRVSVRRSGSAQCRDLL